MPSIASRYAGRRQTHDARLDWLTGRPSYYVTAAPDDRDRRPHPAGGEYAERWWLPILGPTGWLCARVFARMIETTPGGVMVDVDDLAAALGVRHGTTANSPIPRTVARLAGFGVVRVDLAYDTLHAHCWLPDLPARFHGRLPRTER